MGIREGEGRASSKKRISKGLKALIDYKHSVSLIHLGQFLSVSHDAESRGFAGIVCITLSHPLPLPSHPSLQPCLLHSEAVAMGRTQNETLSAALAVKLLIRNRSYFVWAVQFDTSEEIAVAFDVVCSFQKTSDSIPQRFSW